MHRYRYCTVHTSLRRLRFFLFARPLFCSPLPLFSPSRWCCRAALTQTHTHATHTQSGGNDDKDKGNVFLGLDG
ncbi:hypothetical protein J3F84DRAFT_367154 [Trichoderma pleuroticola]